MFVRLLMLSKIKLIILPRNKSQPLKRNKKFITKRKDSLWSRRNKNKEYSETIVTEIIAESRSLNQKNPAKRSPSEIEIRRLFNLKPLKSINWMAIQKIHINNINERTGTEEETPNQKGETNLKSKELVAKEEQKKSQGWFMSKYQAWVGNGSGDSSKAIVFAKYLKNYERDYKTISARDIKLVITREQIENNFDHHFLRKLMQACQGSIFAPQKRMRPQRQIGNLTGSKIFGSQYGDSGIFNSREKKLKSRSLRNSGRTISSGSGLKINHGSREAPNLQRPKPNPKFYEKIIANSERNLKASDFNLKILKKVLSEVRPIFKILRVKKRADEEKNSSINFSEAELRILFSPDKIKRTKYLFSKYRGLFMDNDVSENVLLIEAQLYGVADQLEVKLRALQVKNRENKQVFDRLTRQSLQEAAHVVRKVKYLRLRVRRDKAVSLSNSGKADV